jgi:hypothetical protein
MGKIVEIDWIGDAYIGQNPTEASKALEMKKWCIDRNLVLGADFSWYFDSKNRKTIFKFLGEKENYSTLFALTWK